MPRDRRPCPRTGRRGEPATIALVRAVVAPSSSAGSIVNVRLVDVDEHRRRARRLDARDGRDARVRRRDHLVAGADRRARGGQLDGVRPRRDADRLSRAAEGREARARTPRRAGRRRTGRRRALSRCASSSSGAERRVLAAEVEERRRSCVAPVPLAVARGSSRASSQALSSPTAGRPAEPSAASCRRRSSRRCRSPSARRGTERRGAARAREPDDELGGLREADGARQPPTLNTSPTAAGDVAARQRARTTSSTYVKSRRWRAVAEDEELLAVRGPAVIQSPRKVCRASRTRMRGP